MKSCGWCNMGNNLNGIKTFCHPCLGIFHSVRYNVLAISFQVHCVDPSLGYSYANIITQEDQIEIYYGIRH